MQSAGLTQFVPLNTVSPGHLHPGTHGIASVFLHVLFMY